MTVEPPVVIVKEACTEVTVRVVVDSNTRVETTLVVDVNVAFDNQKSAVVQRVLVSLNSPVDVEVDPVTVVVM